MTAKAKLIPRSILAIVLALFICFGPCLTALAAQLDGGPTADTPESSLLSEDFEPEYPEAIDPKPDGSAIPAYDPQPKTSAAVQILINAYTEAYNAAMSEGGFLATLGVQKPRWQYEVSSELMPKGYHCELVDTDENFGAAYYTFFASPVAAAYGAGFVYEPPKGYGTSITDYFNIINGSTDSVYSNVTVITEDEKNQYGAMWAKEKLDLTLPFSTEMYLHLGHESGQSGEVADGITFTLHNDPKGLTAIGGVGEGLGVFRGRKSTGETTTIPDGTYLRNSLVIEFDTYRNLFTAGAYVNDPSYPGYSAHCALLVPDENADYGIAEFDHKNVFFFNPVQDWVKFDVDWQPNGLGGGVLTYSFDGITNTYSISNITAAFGGTKVYWGFTGTTGNLTSLQAAAITKLPVQELMVEKAVANANGENVDGGFIRENGTLEYTISVSAEKAILGIGPIVITDNLSSHTEYAGGSVSIVTSSGEPFEVTPTLNGSTLVINTGHTLPNVGDWLTATFSVGVKANSKDNIVYNTAIAEATELTEPQSSNTTEVTIVEGPQNPVKTISSDDGKDGSAVTVGDSITYEISYLNYEDSAATIIITDRLPDGVDFGTASNGGIYSDTNHTVTWSIPGVASGTGGTVTVTVEVNKDAVVKIENTANVKVGDNDPLTTNEVENLVTPENPVIPNEPVDRDNHFAYIIGYPDGFVRPQNNITRAEVSTIFFRLLTQKTRADLWSKTNSYSDVDTKAWYNNAISTLSTAKIITGYPDNSFAPNAKITRAELATIAVRFAQETSGLGTENNVIFKDISGHWAEDIILKAAELGYIIGYGDGTFRPEEYITRAEVTTLLNRVLHRQVESEEHMLDYMIVWSDNTPDKWYYTDIQEATNSHFYEKGDSVYETWTGLRPAPQWNLLEKIDSRPEDVTY